MAKSAFDTFIPLSVTSEARTKIIYSFFDLLAAVAANSKKNGLGGRKLSRLAGWWAFEQVDEGRGFDACYRSWIGYGRGMRIRKTGQWTNAQAVPPTLLAISSLLTSERAHPIRLRRLPASRNCHALYKHWYHQPNILHRFQQYCRVMLRAWPLR